MAAVRFSSVVLGLWALEMGSFSLLPAGRLLLDPLFLFLTFLGFRSPRGRWLWLYGFGLGLMKDLAGLGAPLGAWACTFALSGWILGAVRHLVEWEDLLLVGVWAGLFMGASRFLHHLGLELMDPALSWGTYPWAILPWAMCIHGVAIAWAFPALQRLLGKPYARF